MAKKVLFSKKVLRKMEKEKRRSVHHHQGGLSKTGKRAKIRWKG